MSLFFLIATDLYAAAALPQEGITSIEFAKILGFILIVLTLALILFVTLYYRRTLLGGTARWLHLLSLCVVPVFILFLGNFVAYEESKELAFCASCHPVMGPYIDDLKDPNSKSLAAIHFKNRYIQKEQCYTCHVGYGINGTMKAKMEGLGHMYRFLTATYSEPIEIYEPYNNSNCLRCHAGAKRFEGNSVHVAIMGSLKTNKASCLYCHAEAHFEPAANLRE